MSENQSILVVGGAGYLGCVLVEELLNRGYAVTVFDRLFFGDGGLQKHRDRIRLISGDMRHDAGRAGEHRCAVTFRAGLCGCAYAGRCAGGCF